MKMALLIGINYKETEYELNGCINDVENIKNLLINKFNYNEKEIIMITDDTDIKPTRENIINEIEKMIKQVKKNNIEEIWLHYSGHGGQEVDINGDESDGFDETIVPLDCDLNGEIIDDKIHSYFEELPEKCRCICIFDSCHSGTMMDLKYEYRLNNVSILNNKNSKIKAKVCMISGCKDDQTSADAFNVNNQEKWSGAMTSSFLYTLKKYNYRITFGELIRYMRKLLLDSEYDQIPQICSSYEIKDDQLFCSENKDDKDTYIKN